MFSDEGVHHHWTCQIQASADLSWPLPPEDDILGYYVEQVPKLKSISKKKKQTNKQDNKKNYPTDATFSMTT